MKDLVFLFTFIFASTLLAEEKFVREVRVGVKGMVCAFCAQGIEKTFKDQKEVQDIEVSLKNKYVKIKFKEGQKLSNEKIEALLKDAGYEANFGDVK